MGVSRQRHAQAVLPPGKTRYPLRRGLGRSQDRSGRVRKILPPPEFDPRIVQLVANLYTDWATPAQPSVLDGGNWSALSSVSFTPLHGRQREALSGIWSYNQNRTNDPE
jgi:hypothetical protein